MATGHNYLKQRILNQFHFTLLHVPQFAKLEISAVVQWLKTTSATFWTGPQVFHTVHWNMAWREKMARMYHLLVYTLLVSTTLSSRLDIMLINMALSLHSMNSCTTYNHDRHIHIDIKPHNLCMESTVKNIFNNLLNHNSSQFYVDVDILQIFICLKVVSLEYFLCAAI